MPPTAKSIPPRRSAVLMLLVATLFWALSFPMMKALALEQPKLVAGASTWFFTSLGVMYRFGIAAVLLAVFLRGELVRITRLEIEQGLGLALFGVGGILFQMDGLAYTAASTSAFLTQTYVVFILVWVAGRHRRWPRSRELACVALVIAGLAVLAGIDFRHLQLGRGEIETLIAALLFAGQILWLEHPRYEGNAPLRFSVVMFAAMALSCIPLVLLTAPGPRACWQAYSSPGAWGFLAVLVLVCTLGGYLCMNRWQRGVSATEAGLIYCVEPVLASAIALFLPAWVSGWTGIAYDNEVVTPRLLIGGGLVTVANVWLQRA